MKKLNCLLAMVVLVGLFVQTHSRAETLENLTGIPGLISAPGLAAKDVKCLSERGANDSGEYCLVRCVAQENGSSAESEDTTPRTIKYVVAYALLKGETLELRYIDCTVKVIDHGSDAGLGSYYLLDAAQNPVLRDLLKGGTTYVPARD